MKSQPEDFGKIKTLLNIKKHEQPPPRFFRGFASDVLSRLNTPEDHGTPTLWRRLGLDFDYNPVLLCALGVAVCAMLLFGIIASFRMDTPTANPTRLVIINPMELVEPAMNPGAQVGAAVSPEAIPPSTAPVASASPDFSPFNQTVLHSQKVGFPTNGGD